MQLGVLVKPVDLIIHKKSNSICHFTALHGMQTRYSDEKAVRLSVCPSVCLTRAL